MAIRRHPFDDRLLDDLAERQTVQIHQEVWRVVANTRSPLDGSKGSGRWNRRELEVLYTSLEPDGAISEIHFHISRGQSVFPSRMQHALHGLEISLTNVLDLSNIPLLQDLGVATDRYKDLVYERTQEIGSASAFLGYEGLLVPNARHPSNNLVLFAQNIDIDSINLGKSDAVDWRAWRANRR